MEQPVHFWVPSIATAGIGFYTGDALPSWNGNLFVAGLRATRIDRLVLDGERVTLQEPLFGDLWQRVRDGFSMTDLSGSLVAEKTAWYAARPDYLRRVFDRTRLYLYHIVEVLEKRGLPTELALLPMVESSFNPMAYAARR